jgi:hypothetical protein
MTQFDLRIGSNSVRLCWGEAAILVGFVLVGAPWVVLAVPLCAALSDAVRRVALRKTMFNACSDAIGVSLAGLTLHFMSFGSGFGSTPSIVGLALAALVFSSVSHLMVSVPSAGRGGGWPTPPAT